MTPIPNLFMAANQSAGRPWLGHDGEVLDTIATDMSNALDLHCWPAWVVAGWCFDRPGVVIAHALQEIPSAILDLVQNAVRKRMPYLIADVRVTCRQAGSRRVDLPWTARLISVAPVNEVATACGSCGMREVRARRCGFCGGRA